MAYERLTDKSTYSNHTEVFATHLHLEVELDFNKKILFGTVVHTLDFVPGTTSTKYVVDTRKVQITSVLGENGSPLKYTVAEATEQFGAALSIELGAAPRKGQKIHISYKTAAGQDCPGALFLDPEQTANGTHPFYFTQGQAILARSIVPCQDTPARKVTFSASVIVPRPLTAVMSATSIGKPVDVEGGKQKFSFEQNTCVPTYLITIAAGLIERSDISERCAVWAEPSVIKKAAWEFEDVEKFLTTAEKLCGPYVWGRYDVIVLPPAFPYGGMENPQLTFVTPTLLTGDKSKANVIIHEIAHSWSGNLVTNATWEDFWLNEGFTVYTERAVLHEVYGKDVFSVHAELGWQDFECTCLEELSPTHEFTKLRPCLAGVDPDEAFSKIPYEKGFALLLHLQQRLHPGEPCTALHAFLRAYFDKFAYKTVDFNDFKTFLETYYAEGRGASGNTKTRDAQVKVIKDFDWEGWINQPGIPKDGKPQIDTRPVEKVIDMASRTLADPNLLSKLTAEEKGGLEWQSLSPDQKCIYIKQVRGFQTEGNKFNKFLNRIVIRKPTGPANEVALSEVSETLPHPCKALDDAFNFSGTKDPEILHEWIMFCIQLDYHPIKDICFNFIGSQGRIKYVKPIYQRLQQSSSLFRNLAREAFHCHVRKYHAVLAKGVADIVGLDISQARGPAARAGFSVIGSQPTLPANPTQSAVNNVATFGLKNLAAEVPELPSVLKNKISLLDAKFGNQDFSESRKSAREEALRLILAAHPGFNPDKMTPIGVGVKMGKDGRFVVLPDQGAGSLPPTSFAPHFPPQFPVPEELRANIIDFGVPSQVEFEKNN